MNNLFNSITKNDDTIFIQDVPLLDLASQYETPFYLYDGDVIQKRYESMQQFITWPKLNIHYAMKANYNISILRQLKEMGASIDAVSPAEVLLALKVGFEPERIIYTANNITDAEMERASNLGVLINIGSLSRLEKFGKAHPGSSVCLRFNPDVVVGEHAKIQTGGNQSKFGILMNDQQKAVDIVKKYDLRVIGIHKHTGSGISDLSKFKLSMENLLSVADNQSFPHLEFIDFGGGYKVPYAEDEIPIDYMDFGAEMSNMFSRYCEGYGKDLVLFVEPGKYLVAECGLFILQVNTLKNNNGRLIAGTDSGFPHLIRPNLYNAYHHIINISNPHGEMIKYDICGNICESGDRFASDRLLTEIREGDYIAILNAGAYCYSMAGIYNLRALPSEVYLKNNKHRLVTKRFSDEELVDSILSNFLDS